jgi:hypothetical protein
MPMPVKVLLKGRIEKKGASWPAVLDYADLRDGILG